MIVIFVLLALIAIITGLLIFSDKTIKNQQRKQEERKVTNYHGHTVVGFCYPKPGKPSEIIKDKDGRIISIDGLTWEEFKAREQI